MSQTTLSNFFVSSDQKITPVLTSIAKDKTLKPKTNRISKKQDNLSILKEIEKYQISTDLLLAKGPFQKIVKEVANDVIYGLRFEQNAMLALQEAAESYLIELFKDTQKVSTNANKEIIRVQDMRLVLNLKEKNNNLECNTDF